MATTTRSRKAKGRRFQNEVANRIGELLNIPVEKDGDIESRPMGQSGVDIILRGKAKELFSFATEIKNQETFSIPAWVKQAKANQGDFKYWMLAITKNRWDKLVILDMDTFFELYKKVLKNE
jgi:hypothetical protein